MVLIQAVYFGIIYTGQEGKHFERVCGKQIPFDWGVTIPNIFLPVNSGNLKIRHHDCGQNWIFKRMPDFQLHKTRT